MMVYSASEPIDRIVPVLAHLDEGYNFFRANLKDHFNQLKKVCIPSSDEQYRIVKPVELVISFGEVTCYVIESPYHPSKLIALRCPY